MPIMPEPLLPESTWEPREPEVRGDHHPGGVLRHAVPRASVEAQSDRMIAADPWQARRPPLS